MENFSLIHLKGRTNDTVTSDIENLLDKARAYVTDGADEKKNFEDKLIEVLSLDPYEYEQRRKEKAEDLNVRVSWLDCQRRVFNKEKEASGPDEVVENLEPWPELVSGGRLISEIANQIERHVVLPDGASIVVATWILLTFCFDCFRTLPILGVLSPQKRCGKTTLLEIVAGLSYRVLPASNISPAAVFRSIEKFKPTLVIDEADSFIKDNEELRGVLNSGHTRATAFVVRCDGEDNDPKKFSTWAPKAIATIGQLPATIADRSVIIKLRRKLSNEIREKIGAQFEHQALSIRRRCLRWAMDNVDFLRSNPCQIRIQGNDRSSDNWAPLATITSAIGDDWLARLERSAHLIMGTGTDQVDDLPILLLQDCKEVFEKLGSERLHSAHLVNVLNGLEERPWPDLKGGHGLTTNVLARFLFPFGIESKQVRIGVDKKRGYLREHFEDAFNRYIPPDTPVQSGTPVQINNYGDLDEKKSGTKNSLYHFEKQHNQLKTLDCTTVPFQNGGGGEDIPNNPCDEVMI